MAQPAPAPSLAGSFRLFEVAGISVFLHWSWLLVAYFQIQYRTGEYSSQIWKLVEYVSLFAIVLLHEFGHALACRQVGGTANQIVLWPLGGIAFVKPPPRPGAVLWSIAAGPLVNVVLLPITIGAFLISRMQEWRDINPDLDHFLLAVAFMNTSLLIFNMLPIYPLDGGQILQALLWFFIGRARSLLVVSIIGMIAGVAVLAAAIYYWEVWIAIIAAFVAFQSFAGFQQARIMAQFLDAPRREDAACPSCGTAPLMGDFWVCEKCRARFDTFAERSVCPGCGTAFSLTTCPSCGESHPISSWFASATERANREHDGR